MTKTISRTVSAAARQYAAVDVVRLAFESALQKLQAHGLLDGDLVITINSYSCDMTRSDAEEPTITVSGVANKRPPRLSLRERILELVKLGSWTNVELAKRLTASPASVSSLTCRLARQGFIHRRLSRGGCSPDLLPWVYFSPMGVDVR